MAGERARARTRAKAAGGGRRQRRAGGHRAGGQAGDGRALVVARVPCLIFETSKWVYKGTMGGAVRGYPGETRSWLERLGLGLGEVQPG